MYSATPHLTHFLKMTRVIFLTFDTTDVFDMIVHLCAELIIN